MRLGEVQKVETQVILCSVHKALLQRFSEKWKRELAGSSAKRVHVPFLKEPVRLVVGWMIGGGGDIFSTPGLSNQEHINNLKMLQQLVIYLEIDSLVERIASVIKAVTPILPASKASTTSTKPLVKTKPLCFFCNKPG